MPVPSKNNIARFRDCAAPDKQGLTQRQYLFCEYYLKLGDASLAAVKAGYSANTKYSQASQLLNNPKVKAYLARARKTRHANFLMSHEEALRKLSQLAAGTAKEEVAMLAKKYVDGDEVSVEPVIIKKKVDGRVQMQALQKVLELHAKAPVVEDMPGMKSLDEKIHEVMMKSLINQDDQLSIPAGVVFEEDELDGEDDGTGAK
ncbi:MAG: terminase small subunit [Candidatus Izemoplasmatales bacterium]|nr:terminase small subunit [Candidatus Izemoplasmatales bacterium]